MLPHAVANVCTDMRPGMTCVRGREPWAGLGWAGQMIPGPGSQPLLAGPPPIRREGRGRGLPMPSLPRCLRGTHVYRQMNLYFIITSAGTCSLRYGIKEVLNQSGWA